MTGALVLTAAMMGLAGTPHCAAMCAAGCAAAARRCTPVQPWRGVASLLGGRLVAYALAGAVAASLIGGLRWLADAAVWMRPMWTGLQLMLLLLGLWMLLRGRLPEALQVWLENTGGARVAGQAGADQAVRMRLPGEVKAAGLGLLWPVLPCGLLHAALLLAGIASSAAEGAAVMAVFALTSTVGLLVGPAVWLRWVPAALRPASAGGASALQASMSLRLAGFSVATVVGWSLGHSLWTGVLAAWCA